MLGVGLDPRSNQGLQGFHWCERGRWGMVIPTVLNTIPCFIGIFMGVMAFFSWVSKNHVTCPWHISTRFIKIHQHHQHPLNSIEVHSNPQMFIKITLAVIKSPSFWPTDNSGIRQSLRNSYVFQRLLAFKLQQGSCL